MTHERARPFRIGVRLYLNLLMERGRFPNPWHALKWGLLFKRHPEYLHRITRIP